MVTGGSRDATGHADDRGVDQRFMVAASRRMLYRNGLDSDIGGHVSVRDVNEPDSFWITPMQYFDETLPADVCRYGLDLRRRGQDGPPVSAALSFHAAIYAARGDVNAIVHAHSEFISVLSTAAPFGLYYDYAALFLDRVAPTFEDVPGRSPRDEADLIAAALGAHRVMMMRHHGSIHVGSSIERVTVEAICFELCARRQVRAMAIGGEPLPVARARVYRDSYERACFHDHFWDANLRRLRRSDPDLFDFASD